MNMDFEEGYCDGLAGAGMQPRTWIFESTPHGTLEDEYDNACEYEGGFRHGSFDRKTMLTRNTPGSLNAPQPLGAIDGMPVYDAFLVWLSQKNIVTYHHLVQWRKESTPDAFALWAEGMGDGDA
jgi:hypothetical protein